MALRQQSGFGTTILHASHARIARRAKMSQREHVLVFRKYLDADPKSAA
jgi:hypothetical protein